MPLPKPEIDPVVLRHQRERLLAEMFGIESEVPLLAHYELLHELGRGAMGVVYAAHDRKLDRKVAIKKLAVEGDPELRRRLVIEAQAMAKLAHPNVVPVYEIGEVEDTTFIVMAHVEGVGLGAWLAGGPDQASRSRDEILAVFMAAGEGLAAAHAKGIVHRDFKPDNVMVGDDGRVRVMDFGVARSVQRDDEGRTSSGGAALASTRMTQTGALVGTPAYMAPEQLRGGLADAASDQFSFCVALYEALYGARPYTADTLPRLREVVERGQLQPPPSEAEISPWLRAILVRGLASAAEDRFESMRALLDALAAGEDTRAPPEYVFVAHPRTDKLVVLRLCEDLLAHGVRTWLDVWEPDAPRRAPAALAEAPGVLVCRGPGGGPTEAGLDEVLCARIERDSSSVWEVELPDARPDPGPGRALARVRIAAEDDWDGAVARLAAQIGATQDRSAWLADEARLAGVEVDALSPYRGLEAFRQRDARWMFGRERETAELIERLRPGARRFLSVVGGSGSGKSSLVMAGLCPALRGGVLGEGQGWEIAVLRPGARPCEALARALVELQGRRGGPASSVTELGAKLSEDATTLGSVIASWVATGPELEPRARVLLVVDQLEELFTEAGLGPGRASPEAAAFLDNLIKATRSDTGLWVVSTLRADFVHRCLEVKALARVLHAGTYLVLPPMARDQVRAAIEQPARRVGYEVDPTLVAELVNAAAEQPGRLPLLQHVLRELWLRRDTEARKLRYEVYEDTGGLEGAIALAADAALDQLRRELD
ncbi:serine/threonine-protein kinase, partial [Enhygromyxa salina]|uniref:serine/threonine-protein kinase n=1 Tax=Enhygromyxa salina TaxID=215803 RepID=UPI0011B1EB33